MPGQPIRMQAQHVDQPADRRLVQDQLTRLLEILDRLAARTASLEEDVRRVHVARGVRGQLVASLIDRLDEEEPKVAQLSQTTVALQSRNDVLEAAAVEAGESFETMRVSIQGVSDKSVRDDQAISNHVRQIERDHAQCYAPLKEALARLQDDVRAVQARPVLQIPDSSLAADVRRVRQRIELSELDHDARGQLADLLRVVGERGLLPSHENATSAESAYIALKDVTPVFADQRAAETEGPVHSLRANTFSLALRKDDQVQVQRTVKRSAKRRRSNDPGQGRQYAANNHSEMQQTAATEQEESDETSCTPRRSNRKGKGRNEWLESLPGMVTGHDRTKRKRRA